MIETFFYWLRQKLGFRYFVPDPVRHHCGSPGSFHPVQHLGWEWFPELEPGTYRETIVVLNKRPGWSCHSSYRFAGYGVDK